MDRSDSSYVSTLNMTEEQKEKVYGVDSSTLAKGPTLQELNEENPTYVKRDYDRDGPDEQLQPEEISLNLQQSAAGTPKSI